MSSILVKCIPGDSNGLRQIYHLEVYSISPALATTSTSGFTTPTSGYTTVSTSVVSNTSGTVSSSVQPAPYGSGQKPIVGSARAQPGAGGSSLLLTNLTNTKEPLFLVNNLISGGTFALHLYSSNAKGHSVKYTMMATTLGPPEKQMSQGKPLKRNRKYPSLLTPEPVVVAVVEKSIKPIANTSITEKGRAYLQPEVVILYSRSGQ